MNRVGFIVGFLLSLTLTFGQKEAGLSNKATDHPLRIEIPVNSDKETYRIIPCVNQGMVLFYQSVALTSDNAVQWYFVFYDRNLQQVWIRNAPIESGLAFREAVFESDTVLFFFEAGKKQKHRSNDFQILRIAVQTGNLILNNGVLEHPAEIATFISHQQRAYLGLNQEDGVAKILILDLPTGKKEEYPVSEGPTAKICQMMIDEANQKICLQLLKKIGKQTSELQFLAMNLDGSHPRHSEPSYDPLIFHVDDCRMTETSPDSVLTIGSYLQEPKLRKIKENEITGLFSSTNQISGNKSGIHFINFLDLSHVTDLLNERDLLELRKKGLQNPSGTEQKYSLDLSLVLHDIIPWEGQYLMAVESYYPQFRTETYTDYDFYGRPYTNSYNVFDGYRFTGFILTAYDAMGNLLWDNVMDFRNLIRHTLEPNVVIYPENDDIILAYLNEGKIVSKIISRDQTIEEMSYGELMLSSPSDRLLEETKSQMVYWYDHYFLCFGYQEIRDISKSTTDKRLVFFCNKVSFKR